MNLEQCYGEQIAKYPEFMTQQQVCEMCKVSKETVRKWEHSGSVPYSVEINHLIHTHKIWIMDVLKYLYERECRHEPNSDYIMAMRSYYDKQFYAYPDLLTSKDVEKMTGFSQSGIANWLLKGQLKSFIYKTNYKIPKEYLVDFVVSPQYRLIKNKSSKQKQDIINLKKLLSTVHN